MSAIKSGSRWPHPDTGVTPPGHPEPDWADWTGRGTDALAAFDGVPCAAVLKIAGAVPRIDPTLRGLCLAVLAEPEDPGALGALRDWIEERQGRSWLPARVNAIGGPVPLTLRLPLYGWWDSQRCPWAVVWGAWRKLLCPLGEAGVGVLSVADVCDLTAGEALSFSGVKKVRLGRLREWLASLGLSLKGDSPPAPVTA